MLVILEEGVVVGSRQQGHVIGLRDEVRDVGDPRLEIQTAILLRFLLPDGSVGPVDKEAEEGAAIVGIDSILGVQLLVCSHSRRKHKELGVNASGSLHWAHPRTSRWLCTRSTSPPYSPCSFHYSRWPTPSCCYPKHSRGMSLKECSNHCADDGKHRNVLFCQVNML